MSTDVTEVLTVEVMLLFALIPYVAGVPLHLPTVACVCRQQEMVVVVVVVFFYLHHKSQAHPQLGEILCMLHFLQVHQDNHAILLRQLYCDFRVNGLVSQRSL